MKSTTTDWSSYENYPYYTGTNNGMGVYGYAISGGTFFDTRAAAGGATALDNELERLDTCLGHSAPTIYQYHYHAVSNFLMEIKMCFSDSLFYTRISILQINFTPIFRHLSAFPKIHG